MKKKGGRPGKGTGKARDQLLQVRLTDAEKQAFSDAADLAGQDVSVWVRDVLRQAARTKLEENGRVVAFLATKLPGAE